MRKTLPYVFTFLILGACEKSDIDKNQYPVTYIPSSIQKSPIEVYIKNGRISNYSGQSHQTAEFTNPDPNQKDSISFVSKTEGAIYFQTPFITARKSDIVISYQPDSLQLYRSQMQEYLTIDPDVVNGIALISDKEKLKNALTVKARLTDQLAIPSYILKYKRENSFSVSQTGADYLDTDIISKLKPNDTLFIMKYVTYFRKK